MKIIFFGTPDYVLPVVEIIHTRLKSAENKSPIVGVVTQKPRPVGRKKIVTHSPVDNWAHKKNIPIFHSSKEFIKANLKADLGILAAYGEIINKNVINFFPHGILNIHPSLLPKYRGASPIQAAITTGDSKTGVSIIKLDEKLDHGPIVSQFTHNIENGDTGGSLRNNLFEISSQVLVDLIKPFLQGKIKLKPQDHLKATFTKTLTKSDAFIDPSDVKKLLKGIPINKKVSFPFIINAKFDLNAELINNLIKAMKPWPIAWTQITIKKKGVSSRLRLKLIDAHLSPITNKLILDKVQLEGKNEVSWNQFNSSYTNATFE